MMTIAHQVYLAPVLQEYIVAVVSATRRMPELRLGVSPRGSLGVAVGRAGASPRPAAGRSSPPRTSRPWPPTCSRHRMILRPEAQLQGHIAEALLDSILSAVPVPQDRSRV